MKRLFLNILKILIFFVGWAVLSGIIDIPVDNPTVWRFFAELIPFAVIIVFTIVFLLIEKKIINIPIKDNIGKGTLIGSVVGLCWIGIASGVLLSTKSISEIMKYKDLFLDTIFCK